MYYSQFKQDEILENTIFKNYKYGIFVDIGAHDGETFNNTLYFEKNNKWNGYNIEPIPSVFEKLVINRPTCININCAISSSNGIEDFILNDGYTEMLSGLVKNYDERHINRLKNELQQNGGNSKVIKIKTKTFQSLCEEYNIKYINLLTIDVEGAEFDIIKSIDFDKVFIDVILFENNYEDVSEPIIKYLNSYNYRVLLKSGDIYMLNIHSKFNRNLV